MTTRHNVCTNPSCTNDVTGWGGGSTPTRQTGLTGFPVTTGARYNTGTFMQTAAGAASPGLPYTVSMYVRPNGANAGGGTLYMVFQRSVGGDDFSHTVALGTLTNGVVTRISLANVTAPANTTGIYLLVDGIGLNLGGAGSVDFTAVLAEQAAAVDTFFDGNTSGATWDGTAGNSASTLTSGGTTVNASAALTASPTLTAGATATAFPAAALSAAPTLTAAAVRDQPATAALTAAPTLTAAGTRDQPAAVALTTAPTLTAAGVTTTAAAVDLAAAAALTAAGYATTTGAAALAATPVLTAAGDHTAAASVALTAAPLLTAAGIAARAAAAVLAAHPVLTAAAGSSGATGPPARYLRMLAARPTVHTGAARPSIHTGTGREAL